MLIVLDNGEIAGIGTDAAKAGSGAAGLFDRAEWESPVAGEAPEAVGIGKVVEKQLGAPLIHALRASVDRSAFIRRESGSELIERLESHRAFNASRSTCARCIVSIGLPS